MGTFLLRILRNLNLLLVILTILSYFAPQTPPDKSWFLIFLGLGYPWLLLANFLYNFLDFQMGSLGMGFGHHLINRCYAYSVGGRAARNEQSERNRLFQSPHLQH
jgi:hypothetical protein